MIQQKLSEQIPQAADQAPADVHLEQPSNQPPTVSVVEVQEDIGDREGEGAAIATPQTIRNGARIMRQAMARLARLHMEDSDEEEPATVRTSRSRGKKSGSLLHYDS